MKRTQLTFMLGLALLVGSSLESTDGWAGRPETSSTDKVVRVLAASSARDSGILGALLIGFSRQSNYVVETYIAGSGELLSLARDGEGDVLLTNWPAAEQRWMDMGLGDSRRLVMYDRFVLLGPPSDPAMIRGLAPEDALRAIASTRASFVSHGDASGENVRELQVWGVAGLDPQGESWYHTSDEGAARTLKLASDQASYVFSDRPTFRVWQDSLGLEVMVENDPRFINAYHVLTVSPSRFPKSNHEGAEAFASYLVSREAQQIIARFGLDRFSEPLYMPGADVDEARLLAPLSQIGEVEGESASAP